MLFSCFIHVGLQRKLWYNVTDQVKLLWRGGAVGSTGLTHKQIRRWASTSATTCSFNGRINVTSCERSVRLYFRPVRVHGEHCGVSWARGVFFFYVTTKKTHTTFSLCVFVMTGFIPNRTVTHTQLCVLCCSFSAQLEVCK